jgi:hypothetical protein
VKIQYNDAFFDAARKSTPVQHELVRRARAIASGCGPGYAVDVDASGRVSARSSVYTRSYQARRDNAQNNTILRNLDRGRF